MWQCLEIIEGVDHNAFHALDHIIRPVSTFLQKIGADRLPPLPITSHSVMKVLDEGQLLIPPDIPDPRGESTPAAPGCAIFFFFFSIVQRFRGGLVFKAHRLCVSFNSSLECDKEGQLLIPPDIPDPRRESATQPGCAIPNPLHLMHPEALIRVWARHPSGASTNP